MRASGRLLFSSSARRRAEIDWWLNKLNPATESPEITTSTEINHSNPFPEPKPRKNKIIFSGIQPTGIPHLGNYLGALKQWKKMQDEADPADQLIFSIVDLHAITVPREPGVMWQQKREMLASLLALGLDPHRSTIFYQSSVSDHSELQWILSCTSSMGYLSRMTQWKTKISANPNATLKDSSVLTQLKHGLFSYPILQAADILVHRATHVPVGEDQRQHLEFARECVRNFNHTYGGKYLTEPETILSPATKVMSLRSPLDKMSKSNTNERSRILLTDTPYVTHQKIMSALTDGITDVTYDPINRPGVANLLRLFSAFDRHERTPEIIAKDMFRYKEGIKHLKEEVAQAINIELAEFRERYAEIMAKDAQNPEYLHEIELLGKGKAKANANLTMQFVKGAIGLGTKKVPPPREPDAKKKPKRGGRVAQEMGQAKKKGKWWGIL